MWILAVAAFAGECASATGPAQIAAGLERAEKAVRDLEEAGMQEEVVSLSAEVLPCLGKELPSELSARFHRMMSIHLFTLGQEDGAFEAAAAAKGLDPEYVWDDTLLPPDHPIRKRWAEVGEPKTKKVPEPRQGFLVFDGVAGRARPKGVPTISQRLDASGRPTWTTYLGPREPLPTYQEIPRKRNALIGCAVAGGALGAGAWGASLWSKSNLAATARDQTIDAKVLNGKRTRSNVLQGVSWVGFGIGIGCGAGALFESL